MHRSHLLLSAVGTFAGNFLAWAQSLNLGVLATGLSALGLTAVGVYAAFMEARRRNRAAEQELELQNFIRTEQAKTDALAHYDQVHSASMSAQIEALQASLDQGNNRVEDANKKLHQIRDEANVERLRMLEEIARQTAEIRRLTAELHETTEELKQTRRVELDLRQQILTIARQADVNTRKIDSLEKAP